MSDKTSKPAPSGVPATSGIEMVNLIITALSRHRGPMTVTELAVELKSTKSRISRYLQTLRDMGWVKRGYNGRGFTLGWLAVQVGQFATSESPLTELAAPHLLKLRDLTGERVILAIPANLRAVVTTSFSGQNKGHITIRSGALLEFPQSPTTLALYAFRTKRYQGLEAEVIAHIQGDKRFFKDYDEFVKRIERIRQEACAYSIDVKDNRIGSVASPIFDEQGLVAGAVTVVMSSHSFTSLRLSEIVSCVKRCACAISLEMNAPNLKIYD